MRPLDAFQVVVDEFRQPHLTPSDALRKEAALGNLGLPLPVDLARKPPRPYPLTMLPPLLVVVAHPPDARAFGTLEEPPRLFDSSWFLADRGSSPSFFPRGRLALLFGWPSGWTERILDQLLHVTQAKPKRAARSEEFNHWDPPLVRPLVEGRGFESEERRRLADIEKAIRTLARVTVSSGARARASAVCPWAHRSSASWRLGPGPGMKRSGC